MSLSKQEKMFALIEQKDPTQTVSSFCEAHNIRAASFYYWQKRYRELDKEGNVSGFSAIEVAVPSGSLVATVQLPGGTLINVYHAEALSYIQPLL